MRERLLQFEEVVRSAQKDDDLDEDEERGSSLNRRQDDIAAHDATVQERIEVAKKDILEAIRKRHPDWQWRSAN